MYSQINQRTTKTKSAFTMLELIVVAVFLSLLLTFFFLQKSSVDSIRRDENRKTAINAMYYALEEGFFASNGYYPEKISEENLKIIDPKLFTDPYGINLGSIGSSYRYEAANCTDGKCKEYTLRAKLEKEDDYVKKNRSN